MPDAHRTRAVIGSCVPLSSWDQANAQDGLHAMLAILGLNNANLVVVVRFML
jgi:hypothetical protein